LNVSLTAFTGVPLFNRNCSTYSEPLTSHAVGGLAGSRPTLLHSS